MRTKERKWARWRTRNFPWAQPTILIYAMMEAASGPPNKVHDFLLDFQIITQ